MNLKEGFPIIPVTPCAGIGMKLVLLLFLFESLGKISPPDVSFRAILEDPEKFAKR